MRHPHLKTPELAMGRCSHCLAARHTFDGLCKHDDPPTSDTCGKGLSRALFMGRETIRM